ncbi:helix-turn-helix domain-containing protein [Mucilaginibacter sp.]
MSYSQELKDKIPHGFGKIIAEKAGVNQCSVSKFLNGKTKSWKVENAVIEIIKELEAKRETILNPTKK